MSLEKFVKSFFYQPKDEELPPFLAESERERLRGLIHFKGGATTLLQWKKYLGDTTPEEIQAILAKDIGTPTELIIKIDKEGHLGFNVLGRDEGHNYLFLAQRSINFKNGNIEHKKLRVATDHQGKKIGRKFLDNSVTLYKKLGLKQISVLASAPMGSYVWARIGFLPNEKSWRQLSGILKMEFKKLAKKHHIPSELQETTYKMLESRDPRSLWLISDLSHDIEGLSLGKALLTSNAWNGTLDFNNELQMSRFKAYMSEPSTKLEAVNEMWKRKGGYNNKAETGRRRVPDTDRHAYTMMPF